MSRWNAGHKLDGDRYTIKKLLGEGGFGLTYLAKDSKGNLVVIKTINEEKIPNNFLDKIRGDFVREAINLAKCDIYPHIVKCTDFIPDNRFPCIVMEYIPGDNIEELVNKKGRLSEGEALAYIGQVAEGLKGVHERGILHRDIKPANIIIHEETQEAVLIDFGIARQYTPDKTMKHNESNPNISDDLTQAIMKGLVISLKDRSQTIEDWMNLLQNFSSNILGDNISVTPNISPNIKSTVFPQPPVITVYNPNYLNDGIIPGLSGCNVVLSLNGKELITYGSCRTIKVWNLRTGKLLRILQGHSNYVISVAISNDGGTLVSSSGDNTIKVWNLETSKLLHTLEGHSEWVRSVAINYDAKTLVSGSNDKTIKIWNLETGELLRTFEGHYSDVTSVAISENETIVSGSYDTDIRVWRNQL